MTFTFPPDCELSLDEPCDVPEPDVPEPDDELESLFELFPEPDDPEPDDPEPDDPEPDDPEPDDPEPDDELESLFELFPALDDPEPDDPELDDPELDDELFFSALTFDSSFNFFDFNASATTEST